MIAHLKKAKDRVEQLLKKYPETRDDDKLLWLTYLDEAHGLSSALGPEAHAKFKAILMSSNTCSMESVRRVRQKFQEEGLYIGKKRQAKLIEEQNVREHLRS